MANHSEKAATALEWDRFLAYAVREALTGGGRALIERLIDSRYWAGDIGTARLLQAETQESQQLLDREALWGPLQGLPDPTDALERLTRGAVLEIADLALLRRWLYAIESWGQVPRDELPRGDLFRKALAALPQLFLPIQLLDRLLTPEGELSERASPRLAALYGEIRSLKKEIASQLDQLIKTFSQKGVLQEAFTDVRDGRYVIPVKISSQGEIDGIIYEASASRQTVFIEPREVAPLNNRLRQRQNELLQETYRILSEASEKLRPFSGEMSPAVEILTHWDAVQARARVGRHYGGKAITVSEDRVFFLQHTAHPLLWWSLSPESIIRNHVEFGEPVRTLLLTGPNTGGKTVLLKTLGLAGLCARTGFPFPGAEQPNVPFFNSFFADLGDPQSIEEHLSSFSGHVLRFKEILENVTERSLVLIDELNSATDPEEGGALGRAFLETVMERGSMLVTTTHDPHLKATAISDERILNASMEFDESSRSPTYRMVLGVPGRSRALETAERLGLEPKVIEKARGYLSREHIEFESMLSRLEKDAHEAATARREAVALREEAAKLQKEWTERTQASVNEMMDRTRQKLRRILEQAQDEVRAAVRKIDEVRSRKELDSARQKIADTSGHMGALLESALKEEAPEIAETLERAKKEKIAAPAEKPALEPGISVRIPKWKNIGTVLEVKGDRVKVALGKLQMTLSASEVDPLPESRAPKPTARAQVSTEGAPTSRELDLRGQRLDEAMSQLESFLDVSYRMGALEVTIIHGLGTGAIREGTRKLLSRLPYVKNFRDGGVGHGGAGATLVEFER